MALLPERMVTYVERTGSDDIDSARIWAVSDGRAGNARQAEALAGAIAAGAPMRQVLLSPRAPWRWTAPRRLPGSIAAFGTGFATAMTSPPDVVVGCGRQAALATRLLRDQGAKTIQILDPRIDPSHWDLVVVPEHDALRGDNVVTALGGLHPVDDDWLAHARAMFPVIGTLPGPRIALLLGGSSRHVRFDAPEFTRLADMLDAAVAREGGSVLATASRRSSDVLRAAMKARYGGEGRITWCGPDDGDNPYPGLLAWADRIVCSPDSVNMVSEACATHVPVFVAVPDSTQGGPRRFLDALLARGRIRAMDGMLAPFDVEPLRETARIAATVRERLGI